MKHLPQGRPQAKKRIGLTGQSPRIFCVCAEPQVARNRVASDVCVCRICRLVVWR